MSIGWAGLGRRNNHARACRVHSHSRESFQPVGNARPGHEKPVLTFSRRAPGCAPLMQRIAPARLRFPSSEMRAGGNCRFGTRARYRSSARRCDRLEGNAVSPGIQPLAAPTNPFSEAFAPECGIAAKASTLSRDVPERPRRSGVLRRDPIRSLVSLHGSPSPGSAPWTPGSSRSGVFISSPAAAPSPHRCPRRSGSTRGPGAAPFQGRSRWSAATRSDLRSLSRRARSGRLPSFARLRS